MNEPDLITRLAAKGDGVTASGRHVVLAAPGDLVEADGTLHPGPHHVAPPCRHFPTCGGCQLQHADEETLADFVTQRVENAARAQGLVPRALAAPAMSPPRSRRRASLKIANGGGRPIIGFTQAGSHRIVDMRECHVLLPDLFALVPKLRDYFAGKRGKYAIGAEMARSDQGVDLGLTGFFPDGLSETEALLDFARDNGLARLTLDQGYGAEGFWEPEPVTVTLGGHRVSFPAGAFVQATAQAERALTGAALEWLDGCDQVADLFSGLGTFAIPLAANAKVLAAEADRAAVLACRGAANSAGIPVQVEHRDLFRNPLRAEELRGFDAVLLDPPRAGARTQIEQIAASGVGRVVYVSCNPSSWSRDGRVLADHGYALEELRPVGQFRWSTHVELASLFVKHD
ncbi:class I SAM-dependent RNA methyltransferase [Aurantiacibacter spongiae]|uniref:Class I SAM-dependent RNA methyltransferase n=1 Tax=Aurantiacibacter spongiae TaxID=2488860 RepID=A0A3N5DDH3_9SPHN|nr:class I SAM-dependent RNA methyltransferase [Aurantiacibacter spongiae]RPF68835.1 class I SAM-dependent RNA methyltransferase [Aurantiacibacter spongiae]